jgi:serine/threonine-protein kinase HipA
MADTDSDASSRVLNVYLSQIEVGTLALLPDDRTLFAFSQSYLQLQDTARPVLSLWFKTPLGELKTEEKIRSGANLPPFFSNLLPEGHLRAYLAKKVNVSSRREFFLLAALGEDLPGAVRVLPAEKLRNERSQSEQAARQEQHLMRFSLAGIQLKFSAIMEASGGLTIPADGTGGSWIIKLPSHSYKHVPEAEYSMLKLAERVGISVPESQLISMAAIAGLPSDAEASSGKNGDQCLAVKRFDRGETGSRRIHMEDFAQIFGVYPTEKYENASFDRIGFVVLSECGESDFFEFIKRLVFTILIGNGDMHLKNWSLLYSDPRHPRLSPAYDFVPTIAYIPGDNLGLRLGGAREFLEINLANFTKLASRAAASERIASRVVREAVEEIYDAWRDLQTDLPITEHIKSLLTSHMDKLKLRAGGGLITRRSI